MEHPQTLRLENLKSVAMATVVTGYPKTISVLDPLGANISRKFGENPSRGLAVEHPQI